MDARLQQAMNDQIREEFFSAYLYLAMATDMEGRGLSGFAAWLRVQAQEEVTHAMKFVDFLTDRGVPVTFQDIPAPQKNWDSPLAAFRKAHEHERFISGRIHDLVRLAREVGDLAAENFLQWFVEEQVEEEALTGEVVARLELAGDSGLALLMLDREMASRKA